MNPLFQKIFFISFLILLSGVKAQDYQGYVVDESSNKLKNVQLYIAGKEVAITNFNGHFQIRHFVNEDSITFRKNGYSSKQISLANLNEKDTLKIVLHSVVELTPIIVNAKEYKKENLQIGLKQKTNSRLIVKPHLEIAALIQNPSHKAGKVKNIILHLHKTKKDVNLTDLAINFYSIDSLTGLPGRAILSKAIIYRPRAKNRGKRKIEVEKYNIPFPKEGVFVAVKWLENGDNIKKSVGPSIRLTTVSSKRLTFHRHKDGKWVSHGPQSYRTGKVANAMISLNVWVKKSKN